jgi:iron(III) transport system permease protein
MWGWRSSRTLVTLIAVAAFVVVCVLPVLFMLWPALMEPRSIAGAMSALLLDRRQTSLLYNTILLGVGTAVLATLVGAPLGFGLARFELPFKAGLRLALIAPAVLPPYVIALALTYLGGHLAATIGGAIIALAIVLYPLAMLATEVAVRQVEPRLEEAAVLVATPGRVLWRITWPLVAPSVVSAALVIFVLAISEFSVPGLLRVRVFTTEVFTAFAALYDFGRATMLAMPLLIVSVAVAGIAAIRVGSRPIVRRRRVGGESGAAFGEWKPAVVTAIACAILALLVMPVTALAREALRAVSLIGILQGSREAVANSLMLAMAGATGITLLSTCLGYARARATAKVGMALDAFWLVLFTVPSTVVGIGLIAMWNRANAFGVYGTHAIVVLGYLARFVPVGALAIAGTLRSVPESHEEAAAVAGAGWLRTMIRIVLPQIRAGLLAVWVIAFILAFGEVGTSILVAPPGESTLPIRVYTLTANAPPGHVAALALFQSIVILAPLTLLGAALATRETS